MIIVSVLVAHLTLSFVCVCYGGVGRRATTITESTIGRYWLKYRTRLSSVFSHLMLPTNIFLQNYSISNAISIWVEGKE